MQMGKPAKCGLFLFNASLFDVLRRRTIYPGSDLCIQCATAPKFPKYLATDRSRE
jgi:hypothetical protein